jgi:hypothetical protein
MSLTDLCREAHATAVDKGWYHRERGIPELIALIHSELSEALEAYRDGECCDVGCACGGINTETEKPEGIAVELADAVIRIADLCGAYGFDLDRAVQIKMAYNLTRPIRHGNKRA